MFYNSDIRSCSKSLSSQYRYVMYISFSISKNLVDRFKIWKNEEKEGCLAKKKKKKKRIEVTRRGSFEFMERNNNNGEYVTWCNDRRPFTIQGKQRSS